jgi:hypothetical protein
MGIYLLRDGVGDGPYSPDVIGQMLATGNCRPSDLAWQQGIDGWVPLSELMGFPPPPPATSGRPPAGAGASVLPRLLPFMIVGGVFVTFGAVAFACHQISEHPGQAVDIDFIAGNAVMGSVAGLGLFILLLCYIAPTVIAFGRGHHYRWVIAAINVVAGLTMIGWIVAFVWSVWPAKTSFLDPLAGDPVSNSATAGRQIYSRWGGYAKAYSEAAGSSPPRLPPAH